MNKCISVSLLLFLTVINTIALSGCWNYIEIDDTAVVAGVALDKTNENNKYNITIEFILPKGEEKGIAFKPQIVSMEGESLSDIIRNFITQTGLKVYSGHLKVIIINKDIAYEGIVQVLDFLSRDAEVGKDAWVLVSKDENSGKIFEDGKVKFHDTVSYHIHDTMKAQESISKYPAVSLWSILETLSSEETSSTLPAIKLSQDKTPEVNGTAVFKKDKLVGFLDSDESKDFLFVYDKFGRGSLLVSNVGDTKTTVTLEVFDSITRVKPVLNNDSIVMEINTDISANIAELDSTEDFISIKGRERLKKEAEKMVEKQIERVIKKVQQEYQSDIFGFGKAIKFKMPHTWKKIETEWDEIFSLLESRVNVNITIRGSAIKSKTIKVGS